MAKTNQDPYNINKDPQHTQHNKVAKRNRNQETKYPGSKPIPIKPDEFPIEKMKTP